MRFLLGFAMLLPLFGQGGETILELKPEECVYRVGDDLAWAQPDFDDRDWAKTPPQLDEPWKSPLQWARCRVDLRRLENRQDLAIRIGGGFAWDLYVNGEKQGSFGDLQNGQFTTDFQMQIRHLSASLHDSERLLVAMRANKRLGGGPFPAAVGPAKELEGDGLVTVHKALMGQAGVLLLSGAVAVAGLVFLLLYSQGRRQPVLLWWGLVCVAFGILRWNQPTVLFTLALPLQVAFVLAGLGNVVSHVARMNLPFALQGRPVPVTYQILVALEIISTSAFTAFALGWDGFAFAFSPIVGMLSNLNRTALTTAPLAAFWPLGAIRPGKRLLAAFLFADMFLSWLRNTVLMKLLGMSNHWVSSNEVRSIALSVTTLGLLILIARNYQREAEERAELQGEMLAAQEVQRTLVPKALDTAGWAKLDVAYLPAKEVGGDFYFCRSTDAGQVVLVGDVSGKGLRAAMLASAAVGALRAIETSDPARILASLNRSLIGQTSGGFVTCCCICLSPDGLLRVANAGHLSPYVDGVEAEVPAGLPLAILRDATYEETELTVREKVTLLSDGVVEAANAKGELFGFDRTAAAQAKSAAAIVEAAKAWGQNDDITVVTVRRNP